MADDVGVLVARVVADTEQFRSEMLRVSNQLASNTAKMNSALAKVQESTGSLSKGFSALAGVLGQLGVAFSIGAIVNFAANAIKAADAVGEAAAAANIGAERFQRLQLVFAENGVGAEQFSVAMNKLNSGLGKFLQTGAGPAKDAIHDLGLESRILSGQISTQEQFIDAIADALAKMSDRSRASAIGVELLGREGAKLVPVLIQGADALHKAEAAQSGVFSAEQIAKADALRNAYQRLAATIKTELGGAFIDLASAMAGTTPKDVQRREDIASLQAQLAGTKQMPGLAEGGDFATLRLAAEKKLNALIAEEYRALALRKSQIFDDQMAQQSERELETARRTSDELAKIKPRSAGYANTLFGAGDKELDSLKKIQEDGQKEIELRNTVNGSIEAGFMDMERIKREEIQKTTDVMIDNLLEELDAYDRAEQHKRDSAIDTSAAIQFASEALMQASQGHNKRMFEITKKVAIASAIVNTAQAVTKALAEVPFPANFAVAAAVAAAGLLQVQHIRSTQFESASGGASVGGGPAVSTTSTGSSAASSDLQQHKNQTLTVQFMGDVYGWDDYVQKMVVAGLRDAIDGKDVVIIGGNSRQAALLTGG